MAESRGASNADDWGMLVLGMHRSGTSAVAGSLSLLGCNLGEKLLPPGPDNRKGYFEDAAAVRLNDRALLELGRSWSDFRPLPDRWMQEHGIRRLVPAAARIARRLSGRGPWALKDPRLCPLLGLWRQAARDLQCHALLAIRHPFDVARSLQVRDGMPALLGLLLWLRYVQDAVEGTGGMRRAVVDYDALLRDPSGVLAQAGDALRLKWPRSPETLETELSGFLSGSERHHADADRLPLDGCEADVAASIAAVHAAMLDAMTTGSFRKVSSAIREARRTVESARWWQDLVMLQTGIASSSVHEARRHAAERLSMQARIQALEDGLGRAEKLSMQRLQEIEALDGRLRESDEAFRMVERLSMERLRELQTMSARMDGIEAELVEARAVSSRRLQEIEGLNARLHESDQALRLSEGLSAARLHEIRRLEDALAATQNALDEAERASSRQLRRIEELDARLADAQARSHAQTESIAGLQSRLETAQVLAARLGRDLDSIRRSRLWRLLSPLLQSRHDEN
jgi:hypothetical protein